MSGVIIEPFTSIEAAERNFQRLNEAVVALQGGSIAIENVEGYENLATKNDLAAGMDEVRDECRYAVGDVHITEDSVNPKDKFGYGEWLLISQGRCLVGIDDAEPGDQGFQTPGQTGGSKTHTLTVDQIPAHSHQIRQYYEKIEKGDNYHRNRATTDGHVNSYLNSESTGGNQPHSIMQPYYCVYIWRRTA